MNVDGPKVCLETVGMQYVPAYDIVFNYLHVGSWIANLKTKLITIV